VTAERRSRGLRLRRRSFPPPLENGRAFLALFPDRALSLWENPFKLFFSPEFSLYFDPFPSELGKGRLLEIHIVAQATRHLFPFFSLSIGAWAYPNLTPERSPALLPFLSLRSLRSSNGASLPLLFSVRKATPRALLRSRTGSLTPPPPLLFSVENHFPSTPSPLRFLV